MSLSHTTFSRRYCVGAVIVLCALVAPGVRGASAPLAAPQFQTEGNVVPLTLNETVQQADAIALGTITSAQSRWGDASRRWMVTDYSLAVEDLVYPSEKGDPITTTVVLPYWGGTIGNQTQGLSDLRLPVVGERLLVMLRPDWGRQIGIPVVGFNQGLFSIAPDATGGPLVHESSGRHLAMGADGHVARRSAALAAAPNVPLGAFVGWLRANIASIKAARLDQSLTFDSNDPRLMATFAKSSVRSQGLSASFTTSGTGGTETQEPANEVPVLSPWTPTAGQSAAALVGTQFPGIETTSQAYAPSGRAANLPIKVNGFPTSWSWSPEDQYQMSKWNYYATGVFSVYSTPTGTFAWGDGVFDLDGWPSSTQLQAEYGITWAGLGAGVIGVTFYSTQSNIIGEADIALNSAFGFTLDDEWVLKGSGSVQPFRLTMLHELGHMLGLDHQFNYLSVMNYFPSAFRFFALPYMDDAAAIRASYPSKAVSRTDLGVYLYRTNGYQAVTDATYPASVKLGGSLTFNDYVVENVGTATISTPTIEWYLTSARDFSSTYYYLGQKTYSSLAPFTFFTPSSVQATFAVPSNMPTGNYYLAAYIRNDAGYGQGTFPFSNNFAFSRQAIRVDPASTTAPGAFNKSGPLSGATAQPTNVTLQWGASPGAAGYQYCYDTTNDGTCSSWFSTSTALSANVVGLNANTSYYWQVRATNAGGTTYANGSMSAFWSFTTQVGLPGAFSKSSPQSGATGYPTNVSLQWGSSTGATGYQYCYDATDDGGCSSWFSAGTALSANVSGLNANTTYYWQVRATNASGTIYANGALPTFWSFTTQTGLPGAFSKSSPPSGATAQPTNVTLQWGASTGATGYRSCYDTTNDGTCSSWFSTSTALSANVIGLTANTTYYWQVRATSAGGTTYANGSASAFWTFTTLGVTVQRGRPLMYLDGDASGDAFVYRSATGAWARQLTMPGGGFVESTGGWGPGWSILPAAFDVDGLTDLFLSNATTGQWFKMLNTGAGFSVQATGGWLPSWQKFVMDLDGDGISDLFLYDPANGQWYKCVSTPGGFTYYPGAWNPGWDITPVNLNADGIDDMFLINRTTGRWFWILGQNGGGFTSPQEGYWYPGWRIHPGDFNGDGRSDLLLHESASGSYYVALNNGSGFTYQSGIWAPGWTPYVFDLDGNGRADLFLHNKATGEWYQELSDGAGHFTYAASSGAWIPGWDLYTTDFNGDNRTDLLLYNPSTGQWFQAWNYYVGVFGYFGGYWQTGLTIVVGSIQK